jgi:8-oxo-dGTP diphosphatase
MITCTFENGGPAKAGLRHVTVNAIVLKDGQVLMGLRAPVKGMTMLETGKWALLGGFLNRDENAIEAVKREVMEESGWEIGDIRLFRLNDSPNRPKEDRQNVDLVFIANAIKQIGKNDEEVSELKWFPLDSLPPLEQIAFDHGEDLSLYKNYLHSPHDLPLVG